MDAPRTSLTCRQRGASAKRASVSGPTFLDGYSQSTTKRTEDGHKAQRRVFQCLPSFEFFVRFVVKVVEDLCQAA
jgi:hypothetical protein